MSAQYKTKCPHCGAQFKISQEHLKQAGGQVRCGSCLEVFQATEHLVREKPATAASAGQQKKTTAKKPATTKKAGTSGKAAPRRKTPARPAVSEKPAQKSAQWTLPDETPPASGGKDKKKSENDEYLERNDTAVSLGDSELSDSFMNVGEGEDDFGAEDFSDMSGAVGGGTSSSDESWAEALLEELEGDDKGEPEPEPPTPDNMSLLDEYDASDAGVEYEEHAEPVEAEGDDLDFFNEDMLGEDDNEELQSIEVPREEPVEKAPRLPRPAAREGGGALEMLKWGALSLLALVILGIQYLAFNFTELARTPDWRPLYSQFCNTTGCELPNPSNVSKLRGANLVVRDHPRFANALVVDAILFNEADYAQPFPLLELSFSTLNGRLIAARRFAPDEYRSGELTDLERMPPDTPVHVSFEIKDPGADAVNYNLTLHPAPVGSRS